MACEALTSASLKLEQEDGEAAEMYSSTRDVTLTQGGWLRRVANHDAIFVKNLSGGPAMVYIRTKLIPRQRIAGLLAAITSSGAKVAVKFVQDEHREDMDMSVKVSAAGYDSSSFAICLPCDAEHFVSIVRLSASGDKLDEWDCLGLKVRPGHKLILTGKGAPLKSLLPVSV